MTMILAGDVVRNKNTGNYLIVTRYSVWLEEYYERVSCPNTITFDTTPYLREA